jgi:hypothetical protein
MNWNQLSVLAQIQKSSRTPALRKGSRPNRPHLTLETLEGRYTPSGISGHVFQDATGDGFTADDTAHAAGVKVELFRDLNHNGVLDSGDGNPVRVTFSQADGSYAFNNLSGPFYFVKAVAPSGEVRTAPLTSSYYSADVSAGNATGLDFDFFHKPDKSVLQNVHFLINGTTDVTNLRGQVHQGDTVQAFFDVPAGQTVQVTLVSYEAPGPAFDANTASQQKVFQVQTQTFTGPGTFSLTVQVPNSFFQIDCVLGTVLAPLGPANSNIFYTPQGRLISADNGGTTPPGQTASSSLSGLVFLDSGGTVGVFDAGIDSGIGNVAVTLMGTDANGNSVNLQTFTDSQGRYSFTNLAPGTYSVSAALPAVANAAPEIPKVGTVDGASDGVATDATSQVISSIILDSNGGHVGINYNFALRPQAPPGA